MADIAKVGAPSLASLLLPANAKHTGLLAGEAIAAGDACYIKSDGKIWRSNGTSANAAAVCDGFAATAAAVNQAVTLIFNCTVQYGSGLTPGAPYFVSATAGAIADAASTGGTTVVGRAVDATRIFIKKSY
jgi:hypothetical protein